MKKVLTIAGSDCSGGAGIQADIKTITCHKQYAMSVITSMTVQNTCGVFGVVDSDASFVGQQLDCIFEDIIPDAVKVGMVGSVEVVKIIAKKLKQYNAKNIVVDPVMISTSGSTLSSSAVVVAITELLLPLADIITPNLHEAEALSGIVVNNKNDMVRCAKILAKKFSGAILIKGGHLVDSSDDLLYANKKEQWFSADRLKNENTHGTGCTLSSAIACNLADGNDIAESVKNAKDYVFGAINSNLVLGKGRGPLNHMYKL